MSEKLQKAWNFTQFDNVQELRKLVPSEVDPNESTKSETNHVHTLLMCAAAHGAVECCQYLLENRANPIQKNHVGFTALHWAAYTGRIETVKLLLNAGCNVDIRTQDGRTPLHVACMRGHQSFIVELISLKADLNAVSSNGWSCVHYAVVGNQRQIALFLVKKGINFQGLDIGLKSLIDIARTYNRDWVTEILQTVKGNSSVNNSGSMTLSRAPSTASHSADDNEDIDDIRIVKRVGKKRVIKQ